MSERLHQDQQSLLVGAPAIVRSLRAVTLAGVLAGYVKAETGRDVTKAEFTRLEEIARDTLQRCYGISG